MIEVYVVAKNKLGAWQDLCHAQSHSTWCISNSIDRIEGLQTFGLWSPPDRDVRISHHMPRWWFQRYPCRFFSIVARLISYSLVIMVSVLSTLPLQGSEVGLRLYSYQRSYLFSIRHLIIIFSANCLDFDYWLRGAFGNGGSSTRIHGPSPNESTADLSSTAATVVTIYFLLPIILRKEER